MDVATFPLIWRWTQPSHAVLPVDVLQALQPLTNTQIEALGLSTTKGFGSTLVQHQATENADGTVEWLASLPLPGGRVIAVWSKDTALCLPWQTFVTHWSDFCYPSSDDVDIFVEGGPLVLRWHHDGTFEYDVDAL
jgi:hypothetical protein